MVIAERNCTGYLQLVPVEENIVFKGKLSDYIGYLHFFLDTVLSARSIYIRWRAIMLDDVKCFACLEI